MVVFLRVHAVSPIERRVAPRATWSHIGARGGGCQNRPVRRPTIVAVVLASLLSGCGSCRPADPRRAYESEIARARAWLDGLTVDPIELRKKGFKGKKKLVEQLDAYVFLFGIAGGEEKKAIADRVRQIAQVTDRVGYHDMLEVSDAAFKQDATSYLRAAVLLEKLGLDTTRYRSEIQRVAPRLSAHLKDRGPNQRRVFHTYYLHFGLEEPFPLEDALQQGLIARRRDPGTMSFSDAYDLTHEVFALYEFGDRLDLDPFNASEKQYLRATLDPLTRRYIKEDNVDLVAELVTCMAYLRFKDLPAYDQGLKMILASQNADGSWGRYDREREKIGDDVNQVFMLHTTLVVIGALIAAFGATAP